MYKFWKRVQTSIATDANLLMTSLYSTVSSHFPLTLVFHIKGCSVWMRHLNTNLTSSINANIHICFSSAFIHVPV